MSKQPEKFDLTKMAEDLAMLGGLLPGQMPGLRMVLETVDEAAYFRGYAAAQESIDHLAARVLEL